MPTYEFRCPDGRLIERVFKISEVPAEIPAPDGSGMAVRVISGGAGLIFKGSGFYITDYGKDGKKDQREAAKSDAAKSEGAKSEGSKSEGASSSDSGGKGESKSGGSESGSSSTAPSAPASPPPKPSSDA